MFDKITNQKPKARIVIFLFIQKLYGFHARDWKVLCHYSVFRFSELASNAISTLNGGTCRVARRGGTFTRETTAPVAGSIHSPINCRRPNGEKSKLSSAFSTGVV